MHYDLDSEKYKQYFHYGLNYEKSDLLDGIIMNCTQDIIAQNLDRRSENLLKLEKDFAKRVLLQFKRFIVLTDNVAHGWYKKVTEPDVSDEIEQRVLELQKQDLISVVTYKPMWGIYITDREYTTETYTGKKRYNHIPDWLKNDVIPILKYLQELETANPYQYCSLFMDTKYARCIHCNNGEGKEKIEKLYTTFMEIVKPASEDVKGFFDHGITDKQKQYIIENCADYWTITDLKEQSETDKYRKKVRDCYENVKSLEDLERTEY